MSRSRGAGWHLRRLHGRQQGPSRGWRQRHGGSKEYPARTDAAFGTQITGQTDHGLLGAGIQHHLAGPVKEMSVSTAAAKGRGGEVRCWGTVPFRCHRRLRARGSGQTLKRSRVEATR